MSFTSIPRIFFASIILAATLLIANFAFAAAPSIDSALNSSLEESKQINQDLSKRISRPKAFANHKTKERQAVEINLDEADADQAATYKDVQANGDLRE